MSNLLLLLAVCVWGAGAAVHMAVPVHGMLLNDSQYRGPLPESYWITRSACRCEPASYWLPAAFYRDCESWLRSAPDFLFIENTIACPSCGFHPFIKAELQCEPLSQKQPLYIQPKSCVAKLSSWVAVGLWVVPLSLFVLGSTMGVMWLCMNRQRVKRPPSLLHRFRHTVWKLTGLLLFLHFAVTLLLSLQQPPWQTLRENCIMERPLEGLLIILENVILLAFSMVSMIALLLDRFTKQCDK